MARLLAIVLFPFLCRAAWIKFETPSFELYSSAGASAGSDVLRRLEQVRTVFEEQTGQHALAPLPVRVMVFASESDFRSLEPRRSAAGFYRSGTERDYIAMLAGAADLHRVAAHEYIHLLLRHTGGHVPVWLNEGIAEAWSTLEVRGGEVRAGDPIPSHVAKLRAEPLPPLSSLFRAGAGTVSYPQAWALVHMLAFSEMYRERFPIFVSLVVSGSDPELALRQAFAQSVNEVESRFGAYAARGRFSSVRFPAESDRVRVTGAAQPVSALHADLLRWELLVATGNYERSDALLRRLDPGNPEVQQALGDAAQRRKEDAQALEHYRRAMALGNRSAQLPYDYALVRRALGATDAEIIPDLQRSVALDGRLFDPQFLLGYLLLKVGRPGEAVEPLRRAVQLRPWFAPAREELALAESPPAPPARATPATEVRAPELPHVRGTLTQVDCLGGKARLHIIADGRKTFLLVRNPDGVVLRNGGAGPTEFSCGPVPPRTVLVSYRVSADAAYGTAGEVGSITFEPERDKLLAEP